jgi:hypothetical protein
MPPSPPTSATNHARLGASVPSASPAIIAAMPAITTHRGLWRATR